MNTLCWNHFVYKVIPTKSIHPVLKKMTLETLAGDFRSDPLYDIFGVQVFATVENISPSTIDKLSNIQLLEQTGDGAPSPVCSSSCMLDSLSIVDGEMFSTVAKT